MCNRRINLIKINALILSVYIVNFIFIEYVSASNKNDIDKSRQVKFSVLIKNDSEEDSAKKGLTKQIMCNLEEEFRNSLSYEQIDVIMIDNCTKPGIEFQESFFDVIIKLKVNKTNPHPLVESSFIIKNKRISENLSSNSYPQPIYFKEMESNVFKEIIDFLTMIYSVNNGLNLYAEQRFDDAISFLSIIDDELFLPTFSSIKDHFLGNFYLEEAVKLKSSPINHENTVSEAISQYNKSIKKNPHYSPSYFSLGYICAVERSDYQSAESYFKEAVTIENSNFSYNWNLVLVYIENGKNDLARKALQSFISNYNGNLTASQQHALKELIRELL